HRGPVGRVVTARMVLDGRAPVDPLPVRRALRGDLPVDAGLCERVGHDNPSPSSTELVSATRQCTEYWAAKTLCPVLFDQRSTLSARTTSGSAHGRRGPHHPP